MTLTPRCLVRGSINIDEFFSVDHIVLAGETISSTSFTRKAGGKGANQAFAVAKACGIPGSVVLDGAVGVDGVWVRELLYREGVDVARVRVLEDQPTGRAIIQSAVDGENSIVLYKGANYDLPPTDTYTDTSPSLSGFTHLLLQNEIPLSSTLSYLDSASQINGFTTIFNPSPMLSQDELRAFPWNKLGWLIVNEGELESLLVAFGIDQHQQQRKRQTEGKKNVGEEGDEIEERAKGRLNSLRRSKGCETLNVICTLGAKGILYSTTSKAENEIGYLAAAPLKGPVVDTTGAGDCFAGYFAAGLMQRRQDEPLDNILKTCLTACAMCVEKAGAMESYATKDQVIARLSS
ncbi:Ribokinase-like protein [Naematelia encephala]|uniref:Ribokinase n=1 Tax=Naematelia encephala TaxID=71784 RepID=A0A1Y2BJ74_9TREE|nr:Ribokinase-like protein [Naematelia encephala]